MQSRFLAVPLLGVMATVLIVFVLSVAPAFGQNRGDDVQYNAICQNILGSVGDITQGQVGTATAVAANGESTSSQEASAVAEVAQEQGVSIAQVNECLNAAAAEETTAETTDETTGGTTKENTADTTTGDTTAADAEAEVIADTIPDQKVLANTGGPVLLLPALGLLLISSVAIRNLLRR